MIFVKDGEKVLRYVTLGEMDEDEMDLYDVIYTPNEEESSEKLVVIDVGFVRKDDESVVS